MTDTEIIDLYWLRSEKAISETRTKYGALIAGVASNVLKRAEDTEECVNDVYLAAWNSMPESRPQYLCAFLCKIAKNLALKRYHYNKAEKRNSERDCCFEELENICSGTDNEDFETENISALISDFLRSVSEDMRTVFILRYWYYYPVADIAAKLKMSESKVKSILFRARNGLKKYLSEEGVEI